MRNRGLQQLRVLGTCAGCLGEFSVPGAGNLQRVYCCDMTPDPDDDHRESHTSLGSTFSALLCEECRELVTVAELLRYETIHPFPDGLRRSIAWRRSWRSYWQHRSKPA